MITAAAYGPALWCGYIWDDDYHVEHNQALRSIYGLQRIWFQSGPVPPAFPVSSQYYPMVYSSFWLEYQIWKLHPAGYHAVNMILHAIGTILLWRILRFLQIPAAWLAAAIFAVHPVHVETVAWISERKNVLSGVFYFGAALLYLRFALPPPQPPFAHGGPGEERAATWRWGGRSSWLYALALALFLCALLSKSVTCSLPAVLLLVLWWKRQHLTWRDLSALGPFFVLGLALGLLTVWMERHRVGAAGEEWQLSLVERCLIAGRALWFYAGKLVWPVQLTFVYPRWQIDTQAWWQYVYPIGSLGLVLILWLGRQRIGRGVLVGALVFGGTLVPALGFFDVYPMRYSFVADHFQYLASLGVIVPVVAIVYRAVHLRGQIVVTMAACLVLATLGTLTWHQCKVYANAESLWRDTIAKNPGAWIAHNNLGNELESRGQDAQASKHYREAIGLKVDYAESHFNLANVLKRTGDFPQSIVHYQEAIRIRPNEIRFRINLGIALAAHGDLDAAIICFRQALRIAPNSIAAHYNLVNALISQGTPGRAIRQAQRAAALSEHRAPAILDLLVKAYEAGGQFDEAANVSARAKTLRDAAIRDRLQEP